ncbi:MAG: hypothetical protein LQ340_003989 [Diploschistes diacapsis]|nr:MAG: hypothetical protein LQ340_003989 [Diploschistes diacapsis]
MSQDDVLRRIKNRTSSPSLTERVRSFTTLRARVPTPAQTVSVNEAETENETNVDSDDGLVHPERIRNDPGVYRDEHIMQYLEPSQPLLERIRFVHRISREAKMYNIAVLMAIWKTVKDLTEPGAPAEARKAIFTFAEATVTHPEFSSDCRRTLFFAVVQPIDSRHLELQARCLRYLTDKGAKLESFSHDLVQYIKDTIEGQYEALFEIRKHQKNNGDRDSREKKQLPEERGLYSLLGLILDVIENSPQAMAPKDQIAILDYALAITEKTTSRHDMKRAVSVISATIQSYGLPSSHLKTVTENLCAISYALPDLGEEPGRCLLRLLRSKHQAAMVRILLQTLALARQDRLTYTVCGALSVLRDLVQKENERDLPAVSFAQFVEAFWKVHFASRRIRRDCLKTISALLQTPKLADDILQSDWQHLIETVLTATGDAVYTFDATRPLSIREQSAANHSVSPCSESPDEAAADEIYEFLKQIASSLNRLWPRLTHSQGLLVFRFYYELRAVLPPESFDLLVSIMADSGSLRPGCSGWKEKQRVLVETSIVGTHLNPFTYCNLLSQLKQDVGKGMMLTRGTHYWGMAHELLADFPIHQNGWRAASTLVALVVEFWQHAMPPNMSTTLGLCKALLESEPDSDLEANLEPSGRSVAQLDLAGVTTALVELFLGSLTPPYQSVSNQIYLVLAKDVASNRGLPACLRLPALKLLTRLRCDHTNAIFVTKDADSLGLAAALSRTEATMREHRPHSERKSLAAESHEFRKSRTSAYGGSTHSSTKAAYRSSSGHGRTAPKAPLWMYPGTPGLPREPPLAPSAYISKETLENTGPLTLRISEWLIAVARILQEEADWEVYSYVVVHLPSQLCNLTLFSDSLVILKHLRKVLVGQIREGTFREPPAETGVKKGDVALCLINALVVLTGYCEYFEDRNELDDILRAFIAGMGEWERAAKTCVQALTICSHILPNAVSKRLPEILQRMSQIITRSQLTMDVLEFLGGVARLPHLYSDFREEEYRMVFAICVKYLESSREQRLKLVSRPGTARDTSNRTSGLSTLSSSTTDSGHNVDPHKDVPQYVFVLAYHVMTVWFLSLKLADRHKHVGWITKNLAWTDEDGEHMEEQSQVTLDMMLRATYSDLGETAPNRSFRRSDVTKRSWLVGLSIITLETDVKTGETQITKRQASGTTHATLRLDTTDLPAHHEPTPDRFFENMYGSGPPPNVFPNHVFLQIGATAAPAPTPMEPIFLPDDDTVGRAFAAFDRNNTVDGYKVAVIYVGDGQSEEREILTNDSVDPAFGEFLAGIGTKVKLKGAAFNTQGLDKVGDSDGPYTYAWRDRVVEIIYHVPTLMPTDLEDDAQCIRKKSHVGNDYVSIIWNGSGLPFKLDTIPSQFNFVNIVITPEHKLVPKSAEARKPDAEPNSSTIEARQDVQHLGNIQHYYTVQLLSQPSFPRISAASAMKLVPSTALAGLIRQLALSSSIFCNVWANRGDGEYVSSWRNRLREINRLRERYASSGTSTSIKYPGAKGTKTYSDGDAFSGRVQMGGIAEEEGVSVGLDFSRWAGPPPSMG